jgi:SAM-dependent methyltransferase
LAQETPLASAILEWPDPFLQHAEAWLLALAEGSPISAEASAQLEERRLLRNEDGTSDQPAPTRRWRRDRGWHLTTLGSNLAYHCAEFSLQSQAESARGLFERIVQRVELGAGAAVLDVGCGAGQTLRTLQSYQPAERIGLEIDLEALAFGCRLSEANGVAMHFLRGSGCQIPFREQRFTHILCRVALNYMHQRRALEEMVRVLQPDGYLYCSVEGVGFDLEFLGQARSAKQLFCRLREFIYGCLLALTGMQPAPGKRSTGSRAFGTLRRCVKVLARAGCELIYAETTSRYWGLPRSFDIVARKCPAIESRHDQT